MIWLPLQSRMFTNPFILLAIFSFLYYPSDMRKKKSVIVIIVALAILIAMVALFIAGYVLGPDRLWTK